MAASFEQVVVADHVERKVALFGEIDVGIM
jgi:hypothetical protein